jgi:hypothetical protein
MAKLFKLVTGTFPENLNFDRFFSRLPNHATIVVGYRHGVGGRPSIQRTRNSGLIGSPSNISRVEINFDFGGRATVYKTKIVVSGNSYERIVESLRGYIPGDVLFKVAAGTYTSNLLYKVNLTRAMNEFIKNPKKGWSFDLDNNRSKFVRLVVRTTTPKAMIFVFASGSIIINGIGFDAADLESKLFDVLEDYGALSGEEFTMMPLPVRKNLKKKRENMTNARYPLANGTPTEPNMYVRPGPNKKLRLYKIPNNPAFVRAKVIKAYKDIGMNVPRHVIQRLGIPVTKVASPVASPGGYYQRPGPDGQLKKYKIPKGIDAGRKTVIKAYSQAGMKIPNNVKAIFKIAKSPSPVKVPSPPKAKGNVTKRGIFRVNELACKKYTLEKLQGIATSIHVPWAKLTKTKLCRALQIKLMGPGIRNSPVPNFIINNTKHFINRNARKVKRVTNTKETTKALASFKTENLQRFANAMKLSRNGTKAMIIKRLIDKKVSSAASASSSSMGSYQNFLVKQMNKKSSSSSMGSYHLVKKTPPPTPPRRLVKMANAPSEIM